MTLCRLKRAAKRLSSVLRAECARLVAGEAARRGGPQVSEHRHKLGAGPFVLVDRCVVLAVDAAVDGVNQAVALAAGRTLQKGGGEDAFAAGREDDVHRVVHPAGHHRLDAGAVGPAAEDVGGLRDERRLARTLIGLLREGALAPVDPAVRAEVRAVQVVGATGQRLALEPFAHAGRPRRRRRCRSASRCSAARRRRAIRRTT